MNIPSAIAKGQVKRPLRFFEKVPFCSKASLVSLLEADCKKVYTAVWARTGLQVALQHRKWQQRALPRPPLLRDALT